MKISEGNNIEQTLVIFKPDAFERGFNCPIVETLEASGLKITDGRLIQATTDQCLRHYNKDDAWKRKVGDKIVTDLRQRELTVTKTALEYGQEVLDQIAVYMTRRRIAVYIFSGPNAVSIIRKLVGDTEPVSADKNSIRGRFGIDSYQLAAREQRALENLVHCSESQAEADREISIWFA